MNLPTTLAMIVGVADLMIEINEKEPAADWLAFVIAHKATNDKTRQHALDLFDELETELCPRVIWDARERARTVSLPEILQEIEGYS